MPIRLEAYTLNAIVTGGLSWPGHLRDALETADRLVVEQATIAPLDAQPAARAAEHLVTVDDIALAVPDEEMRALVHAVWHVIALEAGPYRIEGELATMPGFDPGRAITRPSGTFVLLRDVAVGLLARPDAGTVRHAQGLVNRYTVDAVEADLMLGFFFPGARMAIDASGSTMAAAGSSERVAAGSADAPGTGASGIEADASAAAPTA